MTRRERLERKLEKRGEWAGKASARSASAFETAGKMAEAIPFGQPILVGHHSERRDRNYRGRIHSKMDKGLELHKLAEHHESKARGLSMHLERSIFDDDSDAIERLQEKVAELKAACDRGNAINVAWRRGGFDAVEAEFGRTMAEAAQENVRLQPWRKKSPFANTNNRAEVRRCEQRIALIQKQRERVASAEAAGGVSIKVHDLGSRGWAVVTFAEKPERAILQALREAGYRWGKGSWQGYGDALPEAVRELADRVEEQQKAEAGECLCSSADGYECVPCENERVADEHQEQERQAS